MSAAVLSEACPSFPPNFPIFLNIIFLATFFTTEPVLIIHGVLNLTDPCNSPIMTQLVKSVIQLEHAVISFDQTADFPPERYRFLQRPRNIILIHCDPTKLRRNAFFRGAARTVLISNNEKEVKSFMHIIWQEARTEHIVGISLHKMQVFVGKYDCIRNKAISVNISEITFKLTEYWRNKPAVNNDCPLIVISNPVPPYVLSNKTETNGAIETKTLYTISEKRNLKVVQKEMMTSESIYDQSKSKLKGCSRLLYNHDVDICFGSIHMFFIPSYLVDSSVPHLNSYLVWIGPFPNVLTPIEIFLAVFTIEAWISDLSVLIAFMIFTICLAKQLQRSPGAALMRAFAAGLNLSTTISDTNIGRFTFVLFYLYTLHTTALYTSTLASFYSRPPFEEAIDTITKAVDSQLPITIYEPHWKMIQRSHSFKHGNFKVVDLTELDIVAKSGTGLWMGELLASIDLLEKIHSYAIVLDPYLYSVPLSFIFPKDSPIRTIFDKTVQQIVEGGLMSKWIDDVKFHTMRMDLGINTEKLPLTMSNIGGCFYILALSSIFSAMIFICEIVFHWGF